MSTQPEDAHEESPLLPRVVKRSSGATDAAARDTSLDLDPNIGSDDDGNQTGPAAIQHYFQFVGPKTYRNFSLSHAMKEEIRSDFIVNFIIVTIPAFFCLFFWRIMNLTGIGLTGGYTRAIWITAITIGPVTFGIFGLIDYFLRYFRVLENYDNITGANSNGNGTSSNGKIHYQPSVVWAVKSYFACLCETIAYELCVFFLNDSHYTPATILANSFFAGLGFFGGLLLSGELITFTQHILYRYNVRDLQTHYSILGVSFRGFWEGFLFSLLSQFNLYLVFGNASVSSNGWFVLDAVIVAAVASLAYAVSGILTSMFAVFWFRKLLNYANRHMTSLSTLVARNAAADNVVDLQQQQQQQQTRVETQTVGIGVVGDSHDIGGSESEANRKKEMEDEEAAALFTGFMPNWIGVETIRYDHLLNCAVEAPSFYFDYVTVEKCQKEAATDSNDE